MQRAVIYARFSSDMQREESIDAQIRACKEHCKRNGYVVTNIYVDEAKSGRSTLKREAYNQMMVDAMDNKFDIVVFHKIDRNARNEFNYYTFANNLEKLGIGYEYAVQPIDDSPEGKMMESMLVGMAAYYSRNLSKETKKGLNENAYKALFNGGVPPFGYRIENQRYVINPHEADGVRLIYSLYLAGHGYGSICETLNQHGYKTREGKNFGKNSLYDILHNEKYIGTYTFNKHPRKEGRKRNMHKVTGEDVIRLENAIPAILTEQEFFAVQEKSAKNKKRAATYKAKENYLLSGKIFCEHCGSAMAGRRYTPRNKTYTYYACLKKERVTADRCPQKQIRKEIIERWVLQILEKEVLSPQSTNNIVDMMIEHFNKIVSESQNNKTALLEEKANAEKKLHNFYKIIENGIADSFDLERLQNIKAEIIEINKKLDNLQNVANCPELNKCEIFETLREFKVRAFENNDIDAKKILIDLFVQKVTINNSLITVTFYTESVCILMVPRTGIEPVRYYYRGILSPLRLPVPPPRQTKQIWRRHPESNRG